MFLNTQELPTMMRAAETPADSFGLLPLEPRTLCAADLVPGGITLIPNYSIPNSSREFVFSVVNTGDTTAPAGTAVDFYLSADGVVGAGDRMLRRSILPAALAPGQRATFNKITRVPTTLADADYCIIARVDSANTVSESNESNNDLPSDTFRLAFNPSVGSIEINKLYLRPGSIATITARNVTNLDPDAGDVRFYRVFGLESGGVDAGRVLLGIGTRVGSDYVCTFTADAAWLGHNNSIIAEAKKSSFSRDFKGLTIEGRRLGQPSIGAFYFNPLVRGQYTGFAATGVSSDAASVSWSFDSNFNGVYDEPARITNIGDRSLGGCVGPTWQNYFRVPDWFPSAPTTVFVIVSRANGVSRIYSTLLSATN